MTQGSFSSAKTPGERSEPHTGATEAAYAHCRAVVAARAKNFLYAFLPLPEPRRRGLEAIYAYCRVADDLADDDGLTVEARAKGLADLRKRLRRALPLPGDVAEEPPPPHPEQDLLFVALAHTARTYGVAREDLDLVAVGCEQDLTVTRYATWKELERYCYLVASAVGLACLPVFGVTGDRALAREEAIALGLAMQLTNIVRDVTEDLARDRVYLPQEDLGRFGVGEQALRDLAAGKAGPEAAGAWRALCAFEVERARGLFVVGARLAPRVERRSRVCPLALASLYGALLDRIEARGFDVFTERASLGAARKLSIMGLALGRGLLMPAAAGRS